MICRNRPHTVVHCRTGILPSKINNAAGQYVAPAGPLSLSGTGKIFSGPHWRESPRPAAHRERQRGMKSLLLRQCNRRGSGRKKRTKRKKRRPPIQWPLCRTRRDVHDILCAHTGHARPPAWVRKIPVERLISFSSFCSGATVLLCGGRPGVVRPFLSAASMARWLSLRRVLSARYRIPRACGVRSP